MTASQRAGQRITVILIPKAEADLRQLQERTNLSRTDLTNRAISLYEFFDAQLRAGHDMVAMDKGTGHTARVLVQLPDAPEGQAQTAGPAFWRGQRPPARHRRRRRLFPAPDWPGWPPPKPA
jgi:hypothetical protein